MKALYASSLIPPEWIAAHGLQPCRLDAEPAAQAPPAGACPYAWCWMRTALAAAGSGCVIFTTECDMMRRLAETAGARAGLPVFLFNVPKAGASPAALGIYRSELERLGRFLIQCGGHAPAPRALAELIRDRGEARKASPQGATLGKSGLLQGATLGKSGHRVPLALIGGPLMPHHGAIKTLIARAGGAIMLDATENGELGVPPAPDPDLLAADPLGALVEMYGGGIPAVHSRPNTAIYEWLAPRLATRAVAGILFVHYPWCDAWHAEVRRMEEWACLPLLSVVLSVDGPVNQHLASRIEAFLEALR